MIEPQNLKILLNLTPFSLPLIPISRLPLTPFDFFNSHHKFLIYLNLISKYCSVKILISIYAIPTPPPSPYALLDLLSPSLPPILLHFMTSHLRPPFCFTASILPPLPLLLREQGITCLTSAILRVETDKT